MKILNLATSCLAAAAMLSLLSACSSDPNPIGYLNVKGEKAYIELDLNVATTRADDGATADEVKIPKVYVYIFNSNGTFESGPHEATPSDNKITIEATQGQKTIYAITAKDVFAATAVANAALTAQTFESTLIDAAIDNLKIMDGKNVEGFVMVGKVQTESLAATKSPLSIPASNKFTIELERLVAKVQVKNAASGNESIGIKTFYPSSFNILQTNTKMKLFSDGKEISSTYEAAEGVGTYQGYNSSYDETSNVTLSSNFTENQKVYLPENIVKEPVSGNTTFIVLKYVVYPSQIYKKESYSSNLSLTNSHNGGTFFAVGAYNSDNQFEDFCKDSNGKILFFETSDAYNQFKTDVANSGLFPNVLNYELLKYENSIAYYRLNISDGEGDNKTYRVLRNKSYQITINSISNLGMPSVADLIPKPAGSPLEGNTTEKSWINSTFAVKGWDNVTQGADL